MFTVIFYLGSILLANFLVTQFGLVHHWGLVFPAGAYAIGLTFSARDLLQHRYGKWWCWLWMGIAGAISALFSKDVALASISAFLVAEGIDWLIFTYVKRGMATRMLLSNIISIPLDSLVFVYVAFGFNFAAIWGQSIVKLVMSALVVAMMPFIWKLVQNATPKAGVAQ